MKKIRSARGAVVDFDLMKIKESIGAEPAPVDVQARQDHIDTRLRRRMRNMKKTVLPTAPATDANLDVESSTTPESIRQTVTVEPVPTAVNETEVEFITTEKDTKPKKQSQQKARNKPPTQED